MWNYKLLYNATRQGKLDQVYIPTVAGSGWEEQEGEGGENCWGGERVLEKKVRERCGEMEMGIGYGTSEGKATEGKEVANGMNREKDEREENIDREVVKKGKLEMGNRRDSKGRVRG